MIERNRNKGKMRKRFDSSTRRITALIKAACLVSATFILPTQAISADIEMRECIQNECGALWSGFLSISGEITPGDAAQLKSMYESRRSPSGMYSLALDSLGGSVTEAMAMGVWLRSEGLSVFVPPDAICASACVYILAAGEAKFPSGKIAIHRPYVDFDEEKDVEDALKAVYMLSVAYFKKMNIPERLTDDMFSVPPEEMKILNLEELRLYRLDQQDMVAGEKDDNRQARRLGITRSEYNLRKSRMNQSGVADLCNKLSEPKKQTDCLLEALFKFGLLIPEKDLQSHK